MKKILAIVISFLIVLLNSCTTLPRDNKLDIVCSIYPYYDFVKEIIGENNETFNLSLVLKPGQDCHSYDPSTQDIIDIKKAELFIYTDPELENWVSSIIDSLDSSVECLKLTGVEGIILKVIEDEHHEEKEHEDEHQDHVHTYDPHIWTSFTYVKLIINTLLEKIVALDPINSSLYQTNALKYLNKINELQTILDEIVQYKVRNKIYFVAPFSFFYMFEEQGIEWKTLYGTCSIEIDPSISDIVDMIDDINNENVKYIYTKELLNSTIDQRITEYTNAEAILLHSCHNVSKDEFEQGITYYDLMKQNLVNLRKGLVQ